jgi:hypothetical protein
MLELMLFTIFLFNVTVRLRRHEDVYVNAS